MSENIKNLIAAGDISLGVEFGSTRIKAVLTTKGANVIAQSDFEWENQVVDGVFSYDLKDVWVGLQDCYAKIASQVKAEYGVELTKIKAMGFSAMMHGYIAFDKENNLLVPFRTWRNTITEQAADILSEEFRFNIPQRWTVAHLYQAILKKEAHIPQVEFVTTLAGYVHWQLTGNKVVGVGEASGIFPVDETTLTYNAEMAEKFDALTAKEGFGKKLCEVFPSVLVAGDKAGVLTKEGALLIDPTGKLEAGTEICPPEGDAGTGMVATNSILPKTGNISAGTSIFAMIVLEKQGMRAPRFTEQDLGAAVQNLMLQAVKEGLGTVWMGVGRNSERETFLTEMFNLPETVKPFAVLAIGYPAEENANRFVDRYDETRVHYNKY